MESHVFWYGDNQPVLREHVGDETVDLIYLDPPFNSRRVYGTFFEERDGSLSDAQRTAFEDYWRWGPEAENAFDEVIHPGRRQHLVPATLRHTMEMLRTIAPGSNLLAYLSMMAVRLVEMRRALKHTGSLYLHCDPTASHYLKLILDALFGATNFRSELIWKRSTAHSDGKQGREQHGRLHDVIFFYTKSDSWTWNPIHVPYDAHYVATKYRYVDESGRKYRLDNLTGPGGEAKGNPKYEVMGVTRHWRYSRERMSQLIAEGRIIQTRPGTVPQYKRFLDEMPGLPLQDLWTDIDPINSQAHERTGYPTQKPVTLLRRIIETSSNPGDLVLDPFCGCGTAVVAAQELNRNWVGIDVTHVAVSVLKKRLEEEFPGLSYRVRGEPEDVASARRLADEKWAEFQAWIVDKVGGMPLNPEKEKKVAKKGKDGGMDGVLTFRDDPKAPHSDRMIMSVKGGKQLMPDMVNALFGVVSRDKAKAGVLLTAYAPTPGMRKTALDCGHYKSDMHPGKRFPIIQIVSVEDIFDPKWRGLEHAGVNTSRKSQPPPGTRGASGDLFKPRKAPGVPPEQAGFAYDDEEPAPAPAELPKKKRARTR